ncbi:MAG: HAD-IC family P-type ATPase, partial [Clostridiaceae bacterium]
RSASVFARVSPKHKLRIVKAFKKKNNIVAMTGDGVNDAPAVKEADIGISMGISGTDVTKEASSMILLDDNFATIVSAVEEGRIIYDNIRKFIRYLLSCNLGEVLTMFLSSLFYLETPLLPIQILFVNLATDGLPAIALGVDPPDKDIMTQRPREKDESVFARGLKEKILLRGTLIGICTIFAFLAGKYYGMNLQSCRTLALGTLIISQLLHVFECRSENHSIFEIKLFTNIYLVAAVGVSILMLMSIIYVPFLQGIFHTVPLKLGQWVIVIFFSSFISFVNSVYLLLRK